MWFQSLSCPQIWPLVSASDYYNQLAHLWPLVNNRVNQALFGGVRLELQSPSLHNDFHIIAFLTPSPFTSRFVLLCAYEPLGKASVVRHKATEASHLLCV